MQRSDDYVVIMVYNYCTVNCGHLELLSTMNNESVMSNGSVSSISVEYPDLPVEGSTIRFSCPPGLTLIGPNSATCTENGEWEPDPRGFTCNDSGGKH